MQNNIPRLDLGALADVQALTPPHTPQAQVHTPVEPHTPEAQVHTPVELHTPEAQVHTPPADGFQTPPQQRIMTPQTPPRLARPSRVARFNPFDLNPFDNHLNIHDALLNTFRNQAVSALDLSPSEEGNNRKRKCPTISGKPHCQPSPMKPRNHQEPPSPGGSAIAV